MAHRHGYSFQTHGNPGSRRGNRESRPHMFGADAMHYRQGTAVATADSPPSWAPEMALDPTYPYTLRIGGTLVDGLGRLGQRRTDTVPS